MYPNVDIAQGQLQVQEPVQIDKEKIKTCFQYILTAPNESIRKEADKFLQECASNSQ